MAVARRRICRGPAHAGPRWLLWTEFHVKKWYDEGKTRPAQLQSYCKACQRGMVRVTQARSRGRSEPYKARGPRMSREEYLRRRQVRQKEYWAQASPEALTRRREYQREYAAIQRRKRGAAVRGAYSDRGRDIHKDDLKLPNRPLLDWVYSVIGERSTPEFLPRGGPAEHRSLNRIMGEGPDAESTLRQIDQVLLAADAEHMMPILYPEDDE